MIDAVGGDHLDLVDYAALDLEHDVLGERLAEVALTRDDHLASVAIEGHVLETN